MHEVHAKQCGVTPLVVSKHFTMEAPKDGGLREDAHDESLSLKGVLGNKAKFGF